MKNLFAASLLALMSSAVLAEEPLSLSTPVVGAVTVGETLLASVAVVGAVAAASNSGGSSNGGTTGSTGTTGTTGTR
jgi:hypothetical protein